MIRVEFQDMTGYAENVVFASDAPVDETMTIEVEDMGEAMDYAAAFSDSHQVRFVPID